MSDSNTADHIDYVTVTIDGVKNEDVAQTMFAAFARTSPDEELKIELEVTRVDDGKYSVRFPVCCWHSSEESMWGVCRYGVPGPCRPEYNGCPA